MLFFFCDFSLWSELGRREILDSLLSGVLGILAKPGNLEKKLDDVDAQQYVLTPDYLLKVSKSKRKRFGSSYLTKMT